MKHRRLAGLLACVIVCCLAGAAFAAKVEVTTSRRLLPSTLYLIGTYDADGRADACVVDRAGIFETAQKIPGDRSSSALFFYIGIEPSRQTAKNIESSGEFTVNIPNTAMLAQADAFGLMHAKSGDDYLDKFSATGVKFERAKDVNAPMLPECPVVLECRVAEDASGARVTRTFDGAKHKLIVAEVVKYHVDTDALIKDQNNPVGQFNTVAADPVFLFSGGGTLAGYYKTSERVGKRYSTRDAGTGAGLVR